MVKNTKNYFDDFKILTEYGDKEKYLKILKLGIEIGKLSNNDEDKFFLKEIENEIDDNKNHRHNINDFEKQIVKIIKPIIDKDVKKNSIEFDRSGWKKIDGNFLEQTQISLGIKIFNINFEGSENDVRLNLQFIDEIGFLNSIFERVPFDIHIDNQTGDDQFTWNSNDRYTFLFNGFNHYNTSSNQLENYKIKLKNILDGEWGKKYVFDILSGN